MPPLGQCGRRARGLDFDFIRFSSFPELYCLISLFCLGTPIPTLLKHINFWEFRLNESSSSFFAFSGRYRGV